MIRLIVRRALRLLACAALVLAAAAPSQGAQVQLPVAVVLPVQILGADSFCTGGFVAGGTATAPTLTCVTGGGPGPLTCSILGAPSGTVAPNSSVSLTMSCSGGTSPYTYSWSPVGGTAATLATSVAATTTFTATATDSAAATSQKSVTVTVSNSGGGGGGAINCSATVPEITGKTIVLDMSWANPTRLYTRSGGSSFGSYDAVVVRFTTGANTAPGNSGYLQAAEYQSSPSGRIATLSASPCDFGGGLLPPGSTTGAAGSNTVTMYFSVGGTPLYGYYPVLQPSTTYYLNIRNATPSSCQSNGFCDMAIDLSKPSGM